MKCNYFMISMDSGASVRKGGECLINEARQAGGLVRKDSRSVFEEDEEMIH